MSDTFTVELAGDCDAITVHAHGFAFRVAEDGWNGSSAQYRYTISQASGIEWRTLCDASDLRGPASGRDPGAVEMFGALCSFLGAWEESRAYGRADSDNRDMFPASCAPVADAIGDGFSMLASDVAVEILKQRAAELGSDAGHAAGTWVFDGNTSTETIQRVLQGIEDGDPEVWDMLPSAPLSGEYAGDPTPSSVMEEIGADELREMAMATDDENYAELESAVCDAYEEAWQTAMVDEVQRSGRAVL